MLSRVQRKGTHRHRNSPGRNRSERIRSQVSGLIFLVPCYSVENGLAEGAFSPLCRKFLKLVKISPSCRSNFIRVYEWAKSENRTSADDDILFWEKPEPQSCTRKNKSLGGRAVL